MNANNRKTNRVFGFGSAAIDFRIQTADFGPDYKDKLLARKIEMLGGGAVANFLVQIARLGGEAFWLGKLGNDWIGREILLALRSEGVNCDGALKDDSRCSPFNVAIYAGERRRRVGGFLLPNSLSALSEEDKRDLAAFIVDGDFLMIEIGELALPVCHDFAVLAKSRHARIVVDVDLDPILQCGANQAEIENMFEVADIIMPNRLAMGTLYPGIAPGELAAKLSADFKKPTVVSAGEQGVYFCSERNEVQHQPAFPVAVVDTVGAGDAFHGGFVYGLSTGRSLPEAVELGAKCGAINCTAAGARTGMPNLAALAAWE